MTSKMEVQMAKNEQEQTTDIIPAITETKEIKSLIYQFLHTEHESLLDDRWRMERSGCQSVQ